MQAFLRANTFNQGSRRVSAFTSSASQSAGKQSVQGVLSMIPHQLNPVQQNLAPFPCRSLTLFAHAASPPSARTSEHLPVSRTCQHTS